MDDVREETLVLRGKIGAAVDNVGRLYAATNDISNSSMAISAAAEELSISITHIADQSAGAAILTSAAARDSEHASQLVTSLSQIVLQIGKIADGIGLVAKREKMLALNAMIEAEHIQSGSSGFAVVAREMKDLAEGTSASSAEAGRLANTVMSVVEQVLTSVETLTAKVTETENVIQSISAAVVQQKQASTEIAILVTGTASSVADLSHAVAEVEQSARRNFGHADNILGMLDRAEKLQDES